MKIGKTFFLVISLFAISLGGCVQAGPKGDKGDPGIQGEPGNDGVSVVSIEKTSSDGLVDTYTITYSDGNTSTFTVTNGADGEQGIQGKPGNDGHTPVITIGTNGNWFVDDVDTGIKAQGPQGEPGNDGLTPYIGENGNWWIGENDTGIKPSGDNGKSAYDIYCEAHPEYVGTEDEWINDLVNGNLGSKNKYTVTFHVGNELLFTKEVCENCKVSRPSREDVSGYTIYDWYYLDDGIRESWKFFGYTVTEDIDLYADFSHRDYTINFIDYENGIDVDNINLSYRDYYELPVLYKTGYTFIGWKDLNGNQWDSSGFYYLSHNATLYAVWDGYEYTASLDPNGGLVETINVPVKIGQEYTLPTPIRENYVFLGWYYNNGNLRMSDNSIWWYLGNVELEAKWTNEISTYVFEPDQGTCSIQSMVIRWEDEYTLPIPERDDWFFDGWYLGDIRVELSGIWNYSNSGGTIRAKWKSPLTIENGKVISCENVEKVIIPKGVTEIGAYAFNGCDRLVDVSIPNTVIKLGFRAFSNCSSLENIKLPDSILEIGSNSFIHCYSLKQIVLPFGITKIESLTFQYCINLKDVIIPDSIQTIEEKAFCGCEELSYFEIFDQVSEVYSDVFAGCSSELVLRVHFNVIPETWVADWMGGFYNVVLGK